MGNKALIPRYSDPYDSGIDSDEGKAVGDAVYKKGPDDMKTKFNNVFNKAYSEQCKNEWKANEYKNTQKTFMKKYPKNGYIKRDYSDEYDTGTDVNRPLMESFKSQEQQKMTSVSPDLPDSKWTGNLDSDNGRSSPPLYEVELTASEDDDSSVLELVIPVQKSMDMPSTYWLFEVLCISCLALH